jgi:hypothetical protein
MGKDHRSSIRQDGSKREQCQGYRQDRSQDEGTNTKGTTGHWGDSFQEVGRPSGTSAGAARSVAKS